MAYTFSVNNTPANGTVAIWTVITTLKLAGWTQVDSGDGITTGHGDGYVTGSGSGAGGLGNSHAWVRIQAPAVNGGAVVNQKREILFQRGTAETAWRIKYSASAGFISGSPSKTVSPTAADQVIMTGTGTDASPTYNTFFGAGSGYRWHVCCGGANEFYSFYAFAVTNGTQGTLNGFYMDVLTANSYPPEDIDPCVIYCSSSFCNNTDSALFGGSYIYGYATTANNIGLRAWMGPTSQADASLTTNNQGVWIMPMHQFFGYSNSVGHNPFNNKPVGIPCWYLRFALSLSITLPYGVKGCSTLVQYPSVQYWPMDTISTVNTKDKIYLMTAAGIWLPWSGDTPTI